MNKYLKEDPWKIIEEGYNPELQKSSESIFSLGNGHMGQRANFEESYSGPSLQGYYIAGIYYPDKTRVGWWKNGYPEYFAKVLNAPSWIGINISFNNTAIDINKLVIISFKRVLDMHEGVLYRSFEAELGGGEIIRVSAERFLSLARRETGGIKYSLKLIRGSGQCNFEIYLDGDVRNEDSNYDEKFWEPLNSRVNGSFGLLTTRTRKTGFVVSTAMQSEILLNNQPVDISLSGRCTENRASVFGKVDIKESDELTIIKLASVYSSRDHPEEKLEKLAFDNCRLAQQAGYDELKKEQLIAWDEKWRHSDIKIEGDVSAQQGIRFSVFQLNQTYSGHDPRLNIGPKGFTGEKYGGSTYWDTEAYCLPFFMNTAGQEIARNLLLYRYNHLQKAIENARKLGFNNGAALFPMVTMNGEECHNEWEITFEEIHRNGAIVFAIYNYVRHTGDANYLWEFGLELIIAVARFWAQRSSLSEERGKYVILGVTGPNEYENNVNNNWYTNYIASWTMRYAADKLCQMKDEDPGRFKELSDKVKMEYPDEPEYWREIADNLHLPEDQNQRIFLQQDGYLDKEQIMAVDLPESTRPLNQNWSWDRILRSCFIKQADVLQGLYFFEDHFDIETHRRNFEFYEPRTVHESSLSPSLHVILASMLGKKEKAYELYHRTARLDLDDYNNEVHEGCHITSMAGSWLAIVEGFGGMRVRDGRLHFAPVLPDAWKSLEFTVNFRNRLIGVTTGQDGTAINLIEGETIKVYVRGKEITLS